MVCCFDVRIECIQNTTRNIVMVYNMRTYRNSHTNQPDNLLLIHRTIGQLKFMTVRAQAYRQAWNRFIYGRFGIYWLTCFVFLLACSLVCLVMRMRSFECPVWDLETGVCFFFSLSSCRTECACCLLIFNQTSVPPVRARVLMTIHLVWGCYKVALQPAVCKQEMIQKKSERLMKLEHKNVQVIYNGSVLRTKTHIGQTVTRRGCLIGYVNFCLNRIIHWAFLLVCCFALQSCS